ncbi:response regulator transcription factor [Paenibacillus sp. JCM 10914]
MMNVLIVDDEPKLREGLKSIVSWHELGYQVVDTAANGSEALEKHRLYSPDLMLIDIRMPGMDGLQLIEAIRAKDSDIHLLILSGYADFDYAKQAIAHRVDGYLLKPVDEEELVRYLLQIKQSIEQEQEWVTMNRAASEWNRAQFLQAWLTEEIQTDAVSRQMAEGLKLCWEHYQVLLVHVQGEEIGSETGLSLKHQLITRFEENEQGVVFPIQGDLAILLPTPVLTSGSRNALRKQLADLVKKRGAGSFTAALGPSVHDLEGINLSYQTAKELMRERFFYPSGEMLSSESTRYLLDALNSGEALRSYDSAPIIEQLYYAVDIGNVEVLHKLIQQAVAAMLNEQYTESGMRNALAELLTSIHNKWTLRRTDPQTRAMDYSDRIAAVFRQRTLEDLHAHVAEFLGELSSCAACDSRDQGMKQIMDLIQRNYSENIKLETLASVFNYNSAYLGKMFKNSTGEYFNTYLDKVRINKAKDLLKQGMKVYQVAEKVGYTNVDYFHSKFKKYVGTSPSNFRKELEL